MMWYDTPEKVSKLQEVAASWVGTPFSPNSRCKGKNGGVSCQMLAEQVHRESGFPFSFDAESGPMSWGGRSSKSLIDEFLSNKKELQALPPDDIRPGDVLGFRIGKCLHHLGVCINEHEFIHCMRGAPAMICPIGDPTYKSRLVKIWRPLNVWQ